jgi:hypothetical protein
MKYAVVVLACILFSCLSVKAQENNVSSDSSFSTAQGVVASNLPPAFSSSRLATLPSELPSSPQVSVQSVFPSYSFQAYVGYTFVRFYAYPGGEANRNGFDLGMTYYPRAGHIGVDGAITAGFGSKGNESSDFAFVGGGPRFRWAAPRGLEIWAHGLVGWANYLPRISGFSQGGLGYEVGGGVDINAHSQHFAIRLEGDMIGTRLYQVSQYSPKVSAGIVYKF